MQFLIILIMAFGAIAAEPFHILDRASACTYGMRGWNIRYDGNDLKPKSSLADPSGFTSRYVIMAEVPNANIEITAIVLKDFRLWTMIPGCSQASTGRFRVCIGFPWSPENAIDSLHDGYGVPFNGAASPWMDVAEYGDTPRSFVISDTRPDEWAPIKDLITDFFYPGDRFILWFEEEEGTGILVADWDNMPLKFQYHLGDGAEGADNFINNNAAGVVSLSPVDPWQGTRVSGIWTRIGAADPTLKFVMSDIAGNSIVSQYRLQIPDNEAYGSFIIGLPENLTFDEYMTVQVFPTSEAYNCCSARSVCVSRSPLPLE